ncbi:hypothetical protein F5ESL0236_07945 [Lactobacillus sp. ESL0236]|uniref:hypothetical protein n=1 Tax=unclassified Lactobacillus TaxID=2620435 RepID=UPI000EFC177D|nr:MULTISPECIES: hypothetical protein [unclassified Lactobacillus]RMC36924.1 hypothetical protein F5ESL0237_08020 [Lactobacillus sp. ESL0237]RMC42583.1 hypothetical protein F5ESL0234_07805 [Lactobacillus sp. ESL0234]RMC43269.1 hypothetical protein F5ESL0236_07945 [Lactobacillus sp. ESL0236]
MAIKLALILKTLYAVLVRTARTSIDISSTSAIDFANPALIIKASLTYLLASSSILVLSATHSPLLLGKNSSV